MHVFCNFIAKAALRGLRLLQNFVAEFRLRFNLVECFIVKVALRLINYKIILTILPFLVV